jgi:hypothetical protein
MKKIKLNKTEQKTFNALNEERMDTTIKLRKIENKMEKFFKKIEKRHNDYEIVEIQTSIIDKKVTLFLMKNNL